MSPTDTGKAMVAPPPHTWVATQNGVTVWRPFVATLTVEPCGEEAQGRIVTMLQDGCVLATVNLSAEQARHLAVLLLPPTPTTEAAA